MMILIMILLWIYLKSRQVTKQLTREELEDILLLINMVGEDAPPTIAFHLKEKTIRLLDK